MAGAGIARTSLHDARHASRSDLPKAKIFRVLIGRIRRRYRPIGSISAKSKYKLELHRRAVTSRSSASSQMPREISKSVFHREFLSLSLSSFYHHTSPTSSGRRSIAMRIHLLSSKLPISKRGQRKGLIVSPKLESPSNQESISIVIRFRRTNTYTRMHVHAR